jgi:N-acetyltransferase
MASVGGGRAEFELQPVLRGELVELRPLRREDFEAVYRAASDPLIWEVHPEPDRYTREVFQFFFESGMESGGAFAVVERASGRIIGSTRFHNLKPEESEVEIGWTFLEREFWGGKYNGEMKRLMLDHAFKFVGRVVFVIGEENWPSRRAVEKIGGKLLRVEEWPSARTGKMMKNVVYGVEKNE